MNPLFDGEVFSKEIDGWTVTWESSGDYRHWCEQRQSPLTSPILLVLFNPGALNKNGERLHADLTLKNIRAAFDKTLYHPFIVNLFDRAAKNADELFKIWNQRDSKELIFPKLKDACFSGVGYCYGKKASHPVHGYDIRKKIKYIQNTLSNLKEMDFPKDKDGIPLHPYRWGIVKVIPTINNLLRSYRNCGQRVRSD